MDFTMVKENLEQAGYLVSCFETAKEAAAFLNQQIDGVTVGFGGSMTLEEMGLYELLAPHNQVFSHWKNPGPETLAKAQTAKVYLSSVNGLAQTGQIVNIDGSCNRISSIVYGHEQVYFVVGSNKIAPDYESALFRARNVAAPKNARRLKRQTPCAIGPEKCHDCKSPERICKALSVLWQKPYAVACHVILIDESLGY